MMMVLVAILFPVVCMVAMLLLGKFEEGLEANTQKKRGASPADSAVVGAPAARTATATAPVR
jgi:hypothetical protein